MQTAGGAPTKQGRPDLCMACMSAAGLSPRQCLPCRKCIQISMPVAHSNRTGVHHLPRLAAVFEIVCVQRAIACLMRSLSSIYW